VILAIVIPNGVPNKTANRAAAIELVIEIFKASKTSSFLRSISSELHDALPTKPIIGMIKKSAPVPAASRTTSGSRWTEGGLFMVVRNRS
jgi:hypothetical protein